MFFNAYPCILNFREQNAIEERKFDCDCTFECEFESIANKVEHYLSEAFLISSDFCRNIIINIHLEPKFLLFYLKFHDLTDFIQGFPNVKKLVDNFKFTVFNPTHIQGILNYIFEMERGVKDNL